MGVLESWPELAVFLTVGLAYTFGKLKLGKLPLGTVMAALLLGLVFGHLTHVEPSRELRWAFFLMFLFANGYMAGPQFIRGMESGGWKALVLSLVVATTGLAATYGCARLLALDPGMAAGLFSGALTSTAAMGTAVDAIRALDLPDEGRHALASQVFIANALTYAGGAMGIVAFVTKLAPRLLRVELRQEAARLEAQLGIRQRGVDVFSAYQKFGARAFRVEQPGLVGRRIAEAERLLPGARYFIERIARDGHVLEARSGDVLNAGDVVAIYGQAAALVQLAAHLGQEMHEPALSDFPVRTLSVVVTNPRLLARPLESLVNDPELDVRSVGLRRIVRGGIELPFGPSSTFDRGDVLELTGPQRAVERVAADIGYPLLPSAATDLTVLGIGIAIGTLAGLPALSVGGVELSLGVSVGVLVAGLFCGWLRTRRPAFGNMPEAALRLMIDFGLAAFVATAGLEAGPRFFEAVGTEGIPLVAAGIVVTLMPPLAALLVGHYLLRMTPILLLAGIAGAQTFTAAMAALQEESESPVAVVGYTVPYAVSSVLLAACGTLIVTLVA